MVVAASGLVVGEGQERRLNLRESVNGALCWF